MRHDILNIGLRDRLLILQENKMTNVTVILSEQDLGDFLEDNQEYMAAYEKELEKRLRNHFGSASVTIDSNALTDEIIIDNEIVIDDEVAHIMNLMTNDWNWLPQ